MLLRNLVRARSVLLLGEGTPTYEMAIDLLERHQIDYEKYERDEPVEVPTLLVDGLTYEGISAIKRAFGY